MASVPASHIYVRHLSDPGGSDTVTRLGDPVPADGRKVPGGWWPPLMLEPGWIRENYHRFDVFHVHFGFDAIGPTVLAEVVQELKLHEKPLVYTMHDLRNPHHPEPDAHAEQQEVLVAAAQALITLTPGAAQVMAARWNRQVHVLPHPHVVSSQRISQPRPLNERFIVAVHVKSLRANMDPLPVLDALVPVVATLPQAVLRIDVHDEIFDPRNHWYAPRVGAALMAYDAFDRVEVRVHPYFVDDELWEYLSSVTVSVLPYRFGTHSGWLEACFDLGTAVIAPNCGFYHQQRPCGEFDFTEHSFDPASLQQAVSDVYQRWARQAAAPRATWGGRRAERISIARAHRAVYESVLR